MTRRSDIFSRIEPHDWVTPSGSSWVESHRANVRVQIPWKWARRSVGTHTLLVTAPDGSLTVGLVSGRAVPCFFTVTQRMVASLSHTQVLHHATADNEGGVIIEGIGVSDNVDVAWFVARPGGAVSELVLYGLGARRGYGTHRPTVSAMMRSVCALCDDPTVQETAISLRARVR